MIGTDDEETMMFELEWKRLRNVSDMRGTVSGFLFLL
jgi:hypothetical protein